MSDQTIDQTYAKALSHMNENQPTKLKIPPVNWDEVPEEIVVVTLDQNGLLHGWGLPSCDDGYWRRPPVVLLRFFDPTIYDTGSWADSLELRHQGRIFLGVSDE